MTGGAGFDPGAGPDGGGAVSLNNQGGNNEYITMGNVSAHDFSGTQPFSLETWVNTGEGGAVVARHYSSFQDGYFLAIGVSDPFCDSGSQASDAALGLSGNGGGTCDGVSIVGPTSTSGGASTDPNNENLNDNAWHEVLLTFDDSEMSLYVDGVFDNSVPYSGIDSCGSVTDFLLGGTTRASRGNCSGSGADQGSYTGLLSDVAVFNEALTAQQVETTFQNPGDPSLADSATATPEPAAFLFCGFGLFALAIARLRPRRADRPAGF